MAKEAFETIQQKQLHGWRLEDLPEYAKEWAQYTFWHYTSMETLEKILEKKSFRLGSIENMNDRDEAILHQADGDRIHAMCFATAIRKVSRCGIFMQDWMERVWPLV